MNKLILLSIIVLLLIQTNAITEPKEDPENAFKCFKIFIKELFDKKENFIDYLENNKYVDCSLYLKKLKNYDKYKKDQVYKLINESKISSLKILYCCMSFSRKGDTYGMALCIRTNIDESNFIFNFPNKNNKQYTLESIHFDPFGLSPAE
jgi:hypothetical protein